MVGNLCTAEQLKSIMQLTILGLELRPHYIVEDLLLIGQRPVRFRKSLNAILRRAIKNASFSKGEPSRFGVVQSGYGSPHLAPLRQYRGLICLTARTTHITSRIANKKFSNNASELQCAVLEIVVGYHVMADYVAPLQACLSDI